jgi:hypothetical protein
MPTVKEKGFDKALEHELRTNPQFAAWFLNKTRFREQKATCVYSRSNNPYGKVPFEELNQLTGQMATGTRESETDVLVVFETDDNKRRFALHIKNKRAGGKFTPRQAQNYKDRAKHWMGKSKYRNYEEWATVLVAPGKFHLTPRLSRYQPAHAAREVVALLGQAAEVGPADGAARAPLGIRAASPGCRAVT